MKKKLMAITLIILLIIMCYIIFNSISSRFTTKRWVDSPDIRYRMIDDLESKHSIKGKTQQEVIEILGEPDNIGEQDYKEEGYYVYFIYYIGSKNEMFEIMHEPYMYLVSFCDGVVIGTSVQPT